MFTFPFEVPEDLAALSAEEFAAFLAQVREFAQTYSADPAATPVGLVATRDLFASVTAEDTRRADEVAAGEAARAELAASLAAPVEPVVEPAAETPPTTPPAAPPATPAAQPAQAAVATLDDPPADPVDDTPPAVVMVASADAGHGGAALANFAAAGALIENRLQGYSSSIKVNPNAKSLGNGHFLVNGRRMARHGNVAFRRQFPDALRIFEGGARPLSVLEHAADERRLFGGSLVNSATEQVRLGRALTAAVGWCAPSEIMYDLCALESLDGILDLPEVQATRGGFQIPEDGGPDFASIFEGIGDEGDVILSEYDIENGAEKVCVEIPCPPFVDVRLDVAYVCITGNLLQTRGYPEAVTRFSQGAMVALAHKVNASVIDRMVTQSGAPIVIPADASGDDAASALLSAVELAIEDIKHRNRMSRTATMEVVLPAWTLAPIRAALARRRGVMAINVTDAEILAAFTTRRAVPRFVYDWQDAFGGQVGGPGGADPITAFPADLQFLVYPAGTWVKPVRDVVNLDTVYDNALLTANQYTALFAEDGFNVLKMCVDSRLYQVTFDPSGVTGCCP